MAHQPPDSESAPPRAALGDPPATSDDPTWTWREIQPVAPVLPHERRTRRGVSPVIGAAGLLVVLALVGAVALCLASSPLGTSVVGAASSPSLAAAVPRPAGLGQQICEDYLAALATRLGVPVATLETALGGAAGDTIDQLVQQGRLTADQATKLKAALPAAGSTPCAAIGRLGLGMGRFPTFGIMPFARGFGHGGTDVVIDENPILDAAATALKTDRATLEHEIAALGKGQDLRTIAAKHGVAYTTFTTAVHAAVKGQFDAAVTKGSLTADQETALLARVDQALAAGRLGEFGHFGGRMGGWGGAAPAKPSPSPATSGA